MVYPSPSLLLFFRGQRLLHSQVTICNWHHGIALSIGYIGHYSILSKIPLFYDEDDAVALLYVSLAKFESGMIGSLHSMPLPACNSESLTPQDFGTSMILSRSFISIGTSSSAISAFFPHSPC